MKFTGRILIVGFLWVWAVHTAQADSSNLVMRLIQADQVRSHRLEHNQGRITYYSFISSGLPKECLNNGSWLQNEAAVNLISDSNQMAPLKIQIVGVYPAPVSNACMITLANALTRLPPDTHSVSNNLTSIERGGQLVLEFSIPRPLPAWIRELIPVEIGGKGPLPTKLLGWKIAVISLMFIIVGLRLILSLFLKEKKNEE
jgi:hypothetical protein